MTTTVPFGLAEQTEIGAYADFVTGAAAPVREALGIGSLQVGPALALAIREDPSRFFNRAGDSGQANRSPWTSWRRCATSIASRAYPKGRSWSRRRCCLPTGLQPPAN